MRIIKPMRLGLLTRPYLHMRRHQVGVAVMAFATMDDAPALLMDAGLWKLAGDVLDEDEIVDLGIPKPCAEFLVSGKAFPHDPATPGRCAVRARVGDLDKALIVTGKRYWSDGRPSDPEPVAGTPLDWHHTYGGQGYEENPVGMGLARGDDGRHPLPNVEPLEDRIERPGQEGTPVSFGPVSPIRPRRFSRVGGFDPAWLEDGFPGLPDTLDPHFFNTASPDQWFDGESELPQGLDYDLWNWHPERPCLSGTLPPWRARCFIVRKTAGGEVSPQTLEEIDMRCTTVWFFPDKERMLLVYHGAVPVETDDGSDLALIMPALESPDESDRGLEHYAKVLRQRLPRETGALYAIRDRDLAPPASLCSIPGLDEEGGVLSRPSVVNQKQRAEDMRQEMLEKIRQAGHNAEDYGLDWSTPEIGFSLDDLPEMVRMARRESRLGKARLLREKRQARETVEKAFAKDQDGQRKAQGLLDGLAAPPGGPPKTDQPGVAALLGMARQAQAERGGSLLSQEVLDLMEGAQRQAREVYRLTAHRQGPVEQAPGGRSVRMRRRVLALMQGSRNLSGLDLTGIDLSGLDLSGAQCRGTWLEGSDLSGTSLAGADLGEAVLTRAILNETDLRGASLRKANLGGMLAARSRFDNAAFAETVLDQAVFAECAFDAAVFEDCQLAGTDFSDCSFDGARLCNAMFWQETRLVRTRFRQAAMEKVTFLDCALEAVDYGQASMTSCVWMQGAAWAPSTFVGARLTTCCAVAADFSGSDFSQAVLKECCLRETPLDRARFDGARLDTCDLSGASLRDSSFVLADAGNSLFMEADLTGAEFRDADLIDALMQKSDLRFADLSGANLFRADISQSLRDDSTRTAGAYVKLVKTLPAAPAGGRAA